MMVKTEVKDPSRIIPSDLQSTLHKIFVPAHWQYSPPQLEVESAEYGACFFELKGLRIRFRVAKTTPTKIGQFVTLWKRIGNGPIQPFDSSDPIDFIVVSTRYQNNLGVFIFPQQALLQHNVFSRAGKGGKRAIRVYPPWDLTVNRQAQKTQQWQLPYFAKISSKNPPEISALLFP
jgi:hypothetical protein